MNSAALYTASVKAAHDDDAILEWEKLADLDLLSMCRAIDYTVVNYWAHKEFITSKLADENILFKENGDRETALHLAATKGAYELLSVVIDAAKLLDSQSPSVTRFTDDLVWHRRYDSNTALHLALINHHEVDADLLAKTSSPARAGHDTKNHLGETPVHLALKLEFCNIVGWMCGYWKGSILLDGPDDCCPTLLHHVLVKYHPGESDTTSLIRARRKAETSYSGYEALFDLVDKNYDTVLSLAVRQQKVHLVKTILEEDPAYQNGRVRKLSELKALRSLAAEKGYTDMVELLTYTYDARKDIGHGGRTPLHTAIVKGDKDSIFRFLREDPDLVSKADLENWTPLHYAAYYDLHSVLDETHVGYVDQSANQTRWVPTPLHVAAKEGHTSTLIKLMDLLPPSLYVAADSLSGQNILHMAVLASNKEMILHILKKCPDEHIQGILKQQDVNGDTPLHLLIRDGFYVPELIKHKKVDRTLKNKQHWTSFDMLYFQEQIITDQVKINNAISRLQDEPHWKLWQHLNCWRRSIKKNSDIPESQVPPNKRETKEKEFIKTKEKLKKEKIIQKKDELDRHRQRANTQIIVTALITTVTFTVGFTMPGGYDQAGDHQGMALLSKKKAFIAFMVSDASALLLSTSSLFLYFIASMHEDPHSVSKLNDASTTLNIISVIAMMLTFTCGTYVVLSHSRALAITVIVISCLFFLLVVTGLLIKWRYNRKQKKTHEV